MAVLPPAVAPRLLPENLRPETPWFVRLLDGRGGVVGSAAPGEDAVKVAVMALTMQRRFTRVFPAVSVAEARRLGADLIMTVEMHDWRVVVLGANSRYPLVVALGPLAAQYWIPWQTVEARVDWEVVLTDAATGEPCFHRRQWARYRATVRSAFAKYYIPKLLNFLRFEATPAYVTEIFGTYGGR